jgi:hypothetical protein
MAEKNYRQYGWPIPRHLQTTIAAIAPDLQRTFTSTAPTHGTVEVETPVDKDHSNRLAAGQGKLEEVDLGPDATARTEQTWKRLHTSEPEAPANQSRRGRYGYAWRKPKAGGKTSEDLRRDQMVEAVLSEAKRISPPFIYLYKIYPLTPLPVDYFDSTAPPPNPHASTSSSSNPTANADDALVEQFRTEYFESMQEKHAARKPAAPPVKGAPPVPTGPKLGGSKSARAKMHKLQQEAAAKKNQR